MTAKPSLSHVEKEHPRMVDVSTKDIVVREAKARCLFKIPVWVTESFNNGDLMTKKGPVFHTAIIAGTQAVKNTALLIPLAHTLIIDHVAIEIAIVEPGMIAIDCSVKSRGPTGVEMESLMGANVSALTIYDMCKSLTFDMEITSTKLINKTKRPL